MNSVRPNEQNALRGVKPAFTLDSTRMLRRNFSLILAMLFAGALTASAQFSGSSQPLDCSNPLNALSSLCTGGAASQLGQQQPSAAYGQGSYTQGAYGQNDYGSGSYGAGQNMQPYGAGAAPGGAGGIHTPVPNYIDQVPYGGEMRGAYRNPYNPYANEGRPPIAQPPTEFQRIVAGATGAMLPIFGADLFRNSTPFNPIDRTPVTSDYVIGPGDQLLIRIWGQVNFNAQTTVDRSGNIYVPQVGNV